jgi:hypothetical protein
MKQDNATSDSSFIPHPSSFRNEWAAQSDAQLLAQCEVDTYRASGPGGQKRNKTSSAVRVRHRPSGLIVIAEESRSQHENKAKALQRLRQAFYLRLREELAEEELTPQRLETRPGYGEALGDGPLPPGEVRRLHLGRKDPRYWPMVGLVLDVLQGCQARVSEAATALGLSTGNLVDFLQSNDKVWEQANQMRARCGLGPLR